MSGADAARPLSNDEIGELDEILGTIPDERDPLDVAMLDGFLVGVLLAPAAVLPGAWLQLVFDAKGREQAWSADEAHPRRAVELIMRRYNELAACIAGREPFDPIVFELEDDAGEPLAGKAGIAALAPWAAGFTNALSAFPGLEEAYERDEELAAAFVGILRHLPADPDVDARERDEHAREQREIDRDVPLADLDEAIDELVVCVLEAAAITRPNQPIRRGTAKVGRNDPCPCGSGRKYKTCHGKDSR